MRAVQVKSFGSVENFIVTDLPVPQPDEDEVLIRVCAAGIIFADTQMRRGDYVKLPSLPFVPGREVAGVVEKVGPGVTKIQPGMRVMAEMHTGGYAEYAKAQARDLVRLPDSASYLQGIVYLFNLRIAYLYYYTFGKVQPGEVMLVHAASGGIGTLVTQIAKRRGDNVVIALASSDDKLAHCRAAGADYCINTRESDYVTEVLRITGGKGVDISMNSVAGPTLETDPLVIRPLGRWLINGYAGGKGLIDPNIIMPKSLTLTIFSVYTVRDGDEFRKATVFLEDWLRTEQLDSCSRTFSLEAVKDAHRWIEERHSYGKISLVP